MAQNPYCLGAEIHAELSEDQGGEEEDDTWSMPSDHDYDDGDGGEEEDDDDEEEEEEEEEEEKEGEQLNYLPYFYLQGNVEDDKLSYVGLYGVIPMPIIGGFDGEFYKGQIFH
ncbi:unnamed protein product [Linum trigynum]|uniref:Uncharacterized protein n=1 Tax=Linum trigynum TaxID=586398 RepID=A0AAV2FWX1_9ROSI